MGGWLICSLGPKRLQRTLCSHCKSESKTRKLKNKLLMMWSQGFLLSLLLADAWLNSCYLHTHMLQQLRILQWFWLLETCGYEELVVYVSRILIAKKNAPPSLTPKTLSCKLRSYLSSHWILFSSILITCIVIWTSLWTCYGISCLQGIYEQ